MKLKMFKIFLQEKGLAPTEQNYQLFMRHIGNLTEFDRLYKEALR
jgi:hypothetical protein